MSSMYTAVIKQNANWWFDQIEEVQEAIVEADSCDFATDDQVSAVFAKYGA